ncbi:hypothetical protein WJX72_001265 [[Myrmecia] bisecta]|uniref:BACK domain-containing protein n=1 Tax=[Myrmecia] bisecta TaxID=41462 RepID=A0AAW1QQ33_9CHLO
MLRVNSDCVLVVPPWECAWLSDADLQLKNDAGCIAFEVKGENDATIIFKTTPGSKRWQHLTRSEGSLDQASAAAEHNYTVILGSHRNSCLKFEKDGVLCRQMEHVPGARLSNTEFTKFWINFDLGHTLRLDTVAAALGVVDLLSPAVESLRQPLLDYLAANLTAVVEADAGGWCSLSEACILGLLSNSCLGCRELALFDATMKWACCSAGDSPEEACRWARPMACIERMLPLIRFPLMSDQELQEVRRHPLVSCSAVLQELLLEASHSREENKQAVFDKQICTPQAPYSVEHKRYIRALTAAEAAILARFQRRHSPACQELMYIFDGDHNGVCHFLGTQYGAQEWVNPVLAERLQVRASSPVCRNTKPQGVVSGQFLRNNFAGPRSEAGVAQTWWSLDLGAANRLMCNYYTLRHDASQDYLRSWALQGSHDGLSWVDLRRHLNDATIRLAGQYASWPVVGHAASAPYRMFRILLLGPNASPVASARQRICLSYIELYGYFHRTSGEACHNATRRL